jgi:hypothetical protein
MYIARYTRPDIIMPVSFLATRSSAPTTDDMNNAFRIVKYLAGSLDKGLVFGKPTKTINNYYLTSSQTSP